MYDPQPPMQPGMSTQTLPQHTPTSVMRQRLIRERILFSIVGLLLLIAVSFGMFSFGYTSGRTAENTTWHQWFQANCMQYPFLLLNSNTHVACGLPPATP